jgi:hypothetical protein
MTNAAIQLQHLFSDTFFTDTPLAPRTPVAVRNPASVTTAAAAAPGVRYFCGGHQPSAYLEPGPLAWDE